MDEIVESSTAALSPCENRMTELRQEAIDLEGSDPARARIIASLSQLYSYCKFYPSDPTLYEWEVSKVGKVAFASGGFGSCWRGLFLGYLDIVMKCSHSNVPPDVAVRVSCL